MRTLRFLTGRRDGPAHVLEVVMDRWFDLVVVGDEGTALPEVCAALRRGLRILVVLRASDSAAGRRFRRAVPTAAGIVEPTMTIVTNAEVVCVDGIDRVEAVVIRYVRTGRLLAVNASAFVQCDG